MIWVHAAAATDSGSELETGAASHDRAARVLTFKLLPQSPRSGGSKHTYRSLVGDEDEGLRGDYCISRIWG